MTRRWCLVFAALLSFVVLREARADDAKHRCAAAAEAAQVARLEGKLTRALESATACDARECPRVVRNDCHEWRASLEALVPSIVVRIAAEDGGAVPNARVRLDGTAFEASATETRIDPGEHELSAEAAGFETKNVRFVVNEGQHRHVVAVILAKEAAAPVEVTPPPMKVTTERAPKTPLPIRLGVFGLAGVGLATFFISGVPAYFDVQRLQRTCAPFCNSHELSGARTRMIVGDVGLAVGTLALGVGTWLTFFGPTKEIPVAVAPTSGGAAIAFTGKMP